MSGAFFTWFSPGWISYLREDGIDRLVQDNHKQSIVVLFAQKVVAQRKGAGSGDIVKEARQSVITWTGQGAYSAEEVQITKRLSDRTDVCVDRLPGDRPLTLTRGTGS